EGKRFTRAVFDTHGNSGGITFNGQWLTADVLRDSFEGRGYDTLFPFMGRIYFSGCNVAEGDAGWSFLEAAARAFLRRGGGVAFGHTSKGFAVTDWAAAFGGALFAWKYGGHVLHLTGESRYVGVPPGGHPVTRFT